MRSSGPCALWSALTATCSAPGAAKNSSRWASAGCEARLTRFLARPDLESPIHPSSDMDAELMPSLIGELLKNNENCDLHRKTFLNPSSHGHIFHRLTPPIRYFRDQR